MDHATDGLARVQSESRIPATTWRQWCAQLELDPAVAVELWDDVCHPLMVSSARAPDLALILQLRAARADLYVDDFRDELPPVLRSISLLDCLQGEALGLTRTRPSLLQLYRHLGEEVGDAPVARSFVRHVGTLALLVAVLPAEFSLPRLVKVIVDGRSALEDLIRLGRRSLAGHESGRPVLDALEALEAQVSAASPGDEGGAEAGAAGHDPDVAAEEPGVETLADHGARDAAAGAGEPAPPRVPADGTEAGEVPAGAQPPPDPDAGWLAALRGALTALFAVQVGGGADPREQADRLRAIRDFEPFAGRIPSMEEARQMTAGNRGRSPGPGGGTAAGGKSRPARPGMATRRTPGGGTVVRTGGGGTAKRAAGGVLPRRAGIAGAGPRISRTATPSGDRPVAPPPPVAGPDGKLAAPVLGRHQLDEAVGHVAAGIGRVRQLDPRVWQLVVEPAAELDDPRPLAEALAEAGSTAAGAADGLRIAAQQQRLRTLLSLPPDRRLQARRFDLEIEAFLNTVGNHRRGFDADSRQLVPLPNVLDHAAAALVRVEALRATVAAVSEAEHPGAVTGEDVAGRFEVLLSDITYLADREVIAAARARADVDVAAVLAAVAADAWIDRAGGAALDYVSALVSRGACDSLATLTAALEESPLQLEPPDEEAPAGELPEALARHTALGEVVDAVRLHVLRCVWSVLRPAHRPAETAAHLDADLRRALRGYARLTPRRERHRKNPKVALPVVSLEKLSGNPELADLFVRLTPDGRLLFVEDYEDGAHIDLYERRESRKRQVHARARERARTGNTGELQTGSSYLHSVGRTRDPFARTREEVMAACVRDDDGEPVIFESS